MKPISTTLCSLTSCIKRASQAARPVVWSSFGRLPEALPLVSCRYAFIHADSSADLVAVEAFKLDELDPDAVRAGLQEYTAKLASLQVGLTMCLCVLRDLLSQARLC